MESWRQYVRGRIASLHATIVIKHFLATCCGRSQESTHEVMARSRGLNESERQAKNELDLNAVHTIIRDMKSTREMGDTVGDEMRTSTTTQNSMQLTSRSLAGNTKAWSNARVDSTGVLGTADDETIIDKGNRSKPDTGHRSQPQENASSGDPKRTREKTYVRLTKHASQR